MKSLIETTPDGRAAAIWESFEGSKFYERAYESGSNLSNYLESLDPSTEHKGERARIDAFGRVCQAAGIVPTSNPQTGLRANTLDELGKDEKTRALVPEIIARAHRRAVFSSPAERAAQISADYPQGSSMNQFAFPAVNFPKLTAAIAISDLVAFQTGITGTVYKPFYMNDATMGRARVAEAAEIPAVTIKGREKSIDLLKYGLRVDTSYESMRMMPIDQLNFHIQRIAILTEAQKVEKILDVLINGDGNANTAATVYAQSTIYSGATSGLTNFNLKAWLAFKMKFKNPYTLTTALATPDVALALMLLSVGTANIPLSVMGGTFAAQQINFLNRGLADGVQVGYLDSAPANKTVAFDKRVAIERVFEIGGSIQEIKRWVERQVESLVMTEVEGWDIIEPDAVKILNHAA